MYTFKNLIVSFSTQKSSSEDPKDLKNVTSFTLRITVVSFLTGRLETRARRGLGYSVTQGHTPKSFDPEDCIFLSFLLSGLSVHYI